MGISLNCDIISLKMISKRAQNKPLYEAETKTRKPKDNEYLKIERYNFRELIFIGFMKKYLRKNNKEFIKKLIDQPTEGNMGG
jgi:hypothetical protein